ncbi:MAG: ABC transporter ATP-binding protein [Chlamydiales bacterium]|nr:ABC transporter ATP-binding protein [Chlamydiia bacterium]MCP5508406.1 ABC transporter ATP-binding protein [Chlamydiales bacterium]
MNILETEELCCFSQRHTLLQNVTVGFEEGKLYGLLGPNGSGKTTLLRLLSRIWSPTSGRILLGGKELGSYSRQQLSRIISYVPQNHRLAFDYRVEEIVQMGRYCHGGYSSGADVRKAMSATDVLHLRDHPVTAISSGEAQRVLIARALATESKVILLDEPTNNLDIKHAERIWEILAELKRQGKLVIIANHDLSRSRQRCDSVVLLRKSRCVGSGIPDKVLTNEIIEGVFEITTALNMSY